MTKVFEGWLAHSEYTETITRLGTMKQTCFGLLDFTAGYHQTPLDPASRVLTTFRAAGGLYQWTRVAMGLRLLLATTKVYIDDVLTHDKTDPEFLTNT